VLDRGRWRELTSSVATELQLRQHTLLAMLEATSATGDPGPLTLQTIDLHSRTKPTTLAYGRADFGMTCRAVIRCSTFESIHLDSRYAYWLELNVSINGASVASQSVVCRQDLSTKRHQLTRWISPVPLAAFTTSFGLGFYKTPAQGGAPTQRYRATPVWAPATTALNTEQGGPCATKSYLTTE
jgi:hypothetical protein